jgi:hypothetical protein
MDKFLCLIDLSLLISLLASVIVRGIPFSGVLDPSATFEKSSLVIIDARKAHIIDCVFLFVSCRNAGRLCPSFLFLMIQI